MIGLLFQKIKTASNVLHALLLSGCSMMVFNQIYGHSFCIKFNSIKLKIIINNKTMRFE